MKANPKAPAGGYHAREHNHYDTCDDHPPCQPVIGPDGRYNDEVLTPSDLGNHIDFEALARANGEPYIVNADNFDPETQWCQVSFVVTPGDYANVEIGATPGQYMVVRDKPEPKTLEGVIDAVLDGWNQNSPGAAQVMANKLRQAFPELADK